MLTYCARVNFAALKVKDLAGSKEESISRTLFWTGIDLEAEVQRRAGAISLMARYFPNTNVHIGKSFWGFGLFSVKLTQFSVK